MKITFLGTNGWYDSATGNTICTLVETRDFVLALDAGFGLAKVPDITGPERPFYIFISHSHVDHVCGLHALNKFKAWSSMTILCGEGEEQNLRGLLRSPYSLSPERLTFKLSFMESPAFGSLPFNLKALPLVHSVPCYGIRLEHEGKILAYAPDTGPCDNMRALAKGADLLLAECSYRVGEHNPGWPHMNPRDNAIVAKEAGAKRLALTHFEALRYSTFADRDAAEVSAREVFPDTFACRDGMAVEI